MDLYSEYIPKQVSWHAQAVAYGWIKPEQTSDFFADLSTTADAFDRIATGVEGLPDVVAEERVAVLTAVERERAQILHELLTKIADLELFVEGQRVDFMENQLRIEREAVFEAIAAERAIIIDEAKKERADTMHELEAMVDDLVETSVLKVVDHFFMRAVQLLVILLVGLGAIAFVAVLVWKKR